MNKVAELTAITDGVTVQTTVEGHEKILVAMLVELINQVLEGFSDVWRAKTLKILVLKHIKETLETLPEEYRNKLADTMLSIAAPMLVGNEGKGGESK